MKVLTVPQIRVAEENAVLNGVFSYSQMMENAGRTEPQAAFRNRGGSCSCFDFVWDDYDSPGVYPVWLSVYKQSG